MPARKKKPKASAEERPSLEESMDELATIVHDLESGQQSLDDAMKKFERGIELMRHCDRQLQAAAGRIEQLQGLSEDGEETVPFDSAATAREARDDDDSSGSLF